MTETTEQAPYVWELTPAEYAATVDKVAAINDRAAKRGFTGRIELTGIPATKIWKDQISGLELTAEVVRVTITGQAPSFAEVGTFAVEVPLDSAKPFLAAAEAAFVLGQKMGTDEKGRDYPRDVRSVSKGDVVRVTRQDEYLGHFAVESFGFQQIPHPTRRQFVPLAGQSLHTSRE
jgi:hypothetical protein